MTRQTSLHGWTVPTEGDENYEDTFDDFFVDLDTNGEIRDVENNINNYSPKEGAKFVATDTENEYIGDGTTWNQLQTSGKNPNFDSVSTDDATINEGLVRGRKGERVDASKFDGVDADARLDNAFSTVTNGDVIYLEDAEYSSDRTINTIVTLIGTTQGFNGTKITAQWTLDSVSISISMVNGGSGGSLIVNENDCKYILSSQAGGFNGITVNADRFVFTNNISFTSITFASGTTSGIVDTVSGSLTVTDNGSNTVGDVT